MPDFGGKSNARGASLGLTSMAIFATHDVIIKHLGQTYSPVQIVFFAALLSFPLLSVILLNDKRGGSLRPVHPGWVVGRVFTTVVTGLCAFYAFSTLPLAQVYPLLFAMPLLVTVFSIPILGEKVGIHRWAAVILGLIGVVIVVRPGQADLAPGHFAAMTAAVTGSLASVIVLLGSFIPLVSTELANTWGLGVYIGQALIIDVFTAFAFLPILVYWLKPRYIFKAHKAAA